MDPLRLFAVPSFPMIVPGDDIASCIVDAMNAADERLQEDDILVIAQKIVSKAEGRLVNLSEVTVTPEAEELAAIVQKKPAIVQVILDDSRSVIRALPGLLIVEQNSGWICANAGVDHSNVESDGGTETVALLPENPDGSAAEISERLRTLTGVAPAVIISDSHGRAWRIGTVGVCIGCFGLPPVWDQRGRHDLHGYELVASEECIADELAAAASLIMGQSDEGRPVVIVRGYVLPAGTQPAPSSAIQRPAEKDAFR